MDKRLRKGTISDTKAAESRKGDKKDKRGGKLSEIVSLDFVQYCSSGAMS